MRKNRHLRTIAELCLAISSQLRHVSTIGKKTVKQQHLLHMFSQYGGLRPTNSQDRLVSLGHPSKFQRVSQLGFVTALMSLNGGQPNFAMFGPLVAWYTTYTFWGFLSPNRILPGAKFTLRPSLVFSYIGSVTARHSSSGREPNFVAWYNLTISTARGNVPNFSWRKAGSGAHGKKTPRHHSPRSMACYRLYLAS